MKKLMLLVVSVGLLFAGLVPFAQTAAAATDTFTWSNVRTIIGSDGTSYAWNGIGDTFIYASTKMPSPSCTVDPTINSAYKVYKGAALIDQTDTLNGVKYTLYTYSAQATGYCKETARAITIGNSAAAGIVYVWVDKGTIQAFPSGPNANSSYNWSDQQTYKSTNGTDFTAGDKICPSRLTATADHRFARVTQSNPPDRNIGDTKVVNGCTVQTNGKNFTVGSPANWALPAGTGTNPVPPGGGGDTGVEAKPTCSVDSLTWIVCPIISVAQGAISSLSGVVKDQLKFSPLASGDTGLKPAWTVFRNLADIFFVLIFFIIIFGTSLGLDNYTVKKILPRLIAAAVLVQFSYLLVGFMVDISNVLGNGIDSLLAAAIPAANKNGNEGGLLAAGAIELIGGVIGAGALLPFVAEFAIPLLLTLASAVIALVAVFVTLQIRIMLIDFLIILSPVAFLLWVLPNTDKYFKMWRETLVKLLLMYPIIVLLLATSNLFSIVITGADQVSNWTKLGAAIAPILAFFLIPATFKFASSALMASSNLVGRAKGRGKNGIAGMQDKAKQNRAYNRQQKGLSKINSLNQAGAATTGFGRLRQGTQRKLAQHQAGLSIDKIDPNRMAGALEKNDKDQLTAAGRLLENDSPSTLLAKALDNKSDQFTSRAATAKLAAIEDTAGLEMILANKYGNDTKNSEWIKATAGNFSGLKEKAPHLVSPGGTAAYDNIKSEKGVRLDNVGANAMVNRRNALKATHTASIGSAGEVGAKEKLDAFDENMRNVVVGINGSTNGVNNINNDTRDTLNQLGSTIGVSVLTPVQKADLSAAQRAGGAAGGLGPSGGGSGTQGDTGGTSGGVAPAPQPHPTPLSQPQQAQQVQTILEQHATQTSTPVGSVETQYTSNPTFKAQVDTAQAHNMSVNEVIRAQTPPKPTSSPLVQPGEKLSPGGIIIPGSIVLPGNRSTGPNPSLRLAPRDQTDEPGDDRSIS